MFRLLRTKRRRMGAATGWVLACNGRTASSILALCGLGAGAVLIGAAYLYGVAVPHAHLQAPSPSHLVVDRGGRYLAELPSRDADAYGFWKLTDIPARVADATVAIEDRRFGWHPGVDPIAVARALWGNATGLRRTSGASTIAMQIARMQYARAHDDRRRSLSHKAREAATALLLTWRYDNATLLRHYLRIVPYGNRIHGIGYAARAYLGKPVADLSWAEIAFLAAIPQAPALSNPYRHSGRTRARQRGQQVLTALARRQVISTAELEVARQQLRRLRLQPRDERPFTAMHAIMHLREVLPAASASRPTVATLDLRWQNRVHDALCARLDEWQPQGAQNAAAVVVDLQSREVLVHVGSSGYWQDDAAGALDHARIQRSPGSTLKPFVYALALERGLLTPSSLVLDAPGPGGVANADHRFLGPMLPRLALANSRNLPAVGVLRDLGLDSVYWALRRFGIHDRVGTADRFGLGLALGAMPTTLLRLVRAYSVFANDGNLQPLRWWAAQPTVRSERVLDTSSVRLINHFLSDPQARLPTFSRVGATQYPFTVALKTGTSQGYRDAWTVAWTPRYLVAAWVGRADARRMHRLGGADSAAWLVRDVMLSLPRTRTGFKQPVHLHRYTVCALTGRAAGPDCPRVVEEWMAEPPRPHQHKIHRLPTVAQAAVTAPQIHTPADGLQLVYLSDVEPSLQSIALRADGAHSGHALLWYVDGKPFARQQPGEPLRWLISPGRHRFFVEVIGTGERSSAVTVTVRG